MTRVQRLLSVVTMLGLGLPVHAQSAVVTDSAPPAAAAPAAAPETPPIDATIVATQEYLKTGRARTVRTGDLLAFPYGRSQPTLSCAPLRTCLIRLQAGETVLGAPALGDSERWIVGLMATGPNGNTPLVYIKPTDCNLTTNLVIATDRHLYTVMLDAPVCNAVTSGVVNRTTDPYTAQLTFYYPDELAKQWADRAAQTAARAATQVPIAPSTTGVPLERLHFAYAVKKDRKFPWSPAHVFDDGTRLYVQRPPSARNAPAPVLFGLNDDGSRAILNVTVSQDYYITDRLVDRAVFVVKEGKDERTLILTRQADGRD